MSVTLNVPRSIENEVRYCANQRGISLSQFIFELVEREAASIRQERERKAEECIAGLDALVKATHGRLDKPYVFSRADAYCAAKVVERNVVNFTSDDTWQGKRIMRSPRFVFLIR